VGRNPQPSIAVQPRTGLSDRWLGLRNFDDEATVQDRIHVDNLDRGDGLCIAFRGMRGVMRRHAACRSQTPEPRLLDVGRGDDHTVIKHERALPLGLLSR
jgi:hypothetical protein